MASIFVRIQHRRTFVPFFFLYLLNKMQSCCMSEWFENWAKWKENIVYVLRSILTKKWKTRIRKKFRARNVSRICYIVIFKNRYFSRCNICKCNILKHPRFNPLPNTFAFCFHCINTMFTRIDFSGKWKFV